jgi:hypothetical protein
MNIYLTKQGKQHGPYSVAQVQTMLNDGSSLWTDFAWYSGLSNWVPLSQVPGLSGPGASAASGPVQRPVLVWIISLFYFVWMPFSLGSALLIYWRIHQNHYASAVGFYDYLLPTLLSICLSLAWAIQFFRLKKNSIYLLMGSLGLSVVLFVIRFATYFSLHLSYFMGVRIFGTIIVIWAFKGLLLYYSATLIRKGVLR